VRDVNISKDSGISLQTVQQYSFGRDGIVHVLKRFPVSSPARYGRSTITAGRCDTVVSEIPADRSGSVRYA
jgi:hypothetical protein